MKVIRKMVALTKKKLLGCWLREVCEGRTNRIVTNNRRGEHRESRLCNTDMAVYMTVYS